jgi:hypothetical protein
MVYKLHEPLTGETVETTEEFLMFKQYAKIIIPAAVLGFGCTHTTEEDLRDNYEESAESRIDRMEDNIESLEKRAEQLLGDPRQELTSNVEELKARKATAEAELEELENREGETWVQKKETLDKALVEMDKAYDKALGTLAH